MEITIGGKRVSYIDQGQGAPVILLHGWGAPAALYRLVIDHLAARFRVIAPDLPGFGGSEEPAAPWCVDDYVDFAAAFAAALGIERATLIGHSFGGRIIIKWMARRPAAFTADRIILMDAAGIRPKRGFSYYRKVYTYKLAKKAVNTRLVRLMYPALAETLQKKSGSEDYRNASPLMKQTMVRCINEDLTPCLGAIAAPTLLIWGENDDATPLSDGKTMERLIPDAGLVTVPHAGHFAFADNWGLCRAVIDSFMKADP